MPNITVPTFLDSLNPNELVQDSIIGECEDCGKRNRVAFRAWFRAGRPSCKQCGGLLTPSESAQKEFPQLRTQEWVDQNPTPDTPRLTPKTHCYYCGTKVSVARNRWKCLKCSKEFQARLWALTQEYAVAEEDRSEEFPRMAAYRKLGMRGLFRALFENPIQEVLDKDDQVIGYRCGTHKPDATIILWVESEGLIERKHCGFVLTDLGIKVLVMYRATGSNVGIR